MKDTRLLHASVSIAGVHDALDEVIGEGVHDRLDAEALAAVLQLLVTAESLLTLVYEAAA